MLLTDSDIVTQADLVRIEAQVPAIAAAENIVVEGDGSVIRQNWAEARNELLQAQQQYSVGYFGGLNALTLGTSFSNAPRVKASQICAGSNYSADVSSVKIWMIYRALAGFYDQASNRKVNDRYEKKTQRYLAETKRTWNSLWSNGIPVVFEPLECPGALHSFAGGTWDASNVTGVAGGASAEATLDVAITYVDQTKYTSAASKGNSESGPGTVITFTLPLHNYLQVSIVGLNPPNGQGDPVGIADGNVRPLNASGWNIYAAPTGGLLRLQNNAPIPIGTLTYTFAGAISTTGPIIGPGQFQDRNIPLTRLFDRA